MTPDQIAEAERIVRKMWTGIKRAELDDLAMYAVASLRIAGWLVDPREATGSAEADDPSGRDAEMYGDGWHAGMKWLCERAGHPLIDSLAEDGTTIERTCACDWFGTPRSAAGPEQELSAEGAEAVSEKPGHGPASAPEAAVDAAADDRVSCVCGALSPDTHKRDCPVRANEFVTWDEIPTLASPDVPADEVAPRPWTVVTETEHGDYGSVIGGEVVGVKDAKGEWVFKSADDFGQNDYANYCAIVSAVNASGSATYAEAIEHLHGLSYGELRDAFELLPAEERARWARVLRGDFRSATSQPHVHTEDCWNYNDPTRPYCVEGD